MKKLKKFFREFSLTKDFYAKLIEIKGNKIKHDNLQKGGIDLISEVQELLEKADVKFFFDMGTLLGIIREGRLLKHDMDIDIAVFVNSEEEKKSLTDLLVSHGCVERYKFYTEELGVVEQSFLYYNIKFDINYYHRNGDSDVCYLFYFNPDKVYEKNTMSVVKLSCPAVDKIVKHKFKGISVNVPDNAENYLAVRYGENWRIPDKKYVYWQGPSTTPIDYIGHCVIMNEEEKPE